MYKVILALALAALLVSACGPQNASGGGQLAGTNWLLDTLKGQSIMTGTAITLDFVDETHLAGSDGCNRYNAAYTASGSSFSVRQPIATTMMMCPDAIMQQGSAYLEALGKATSYKSDGQKLTLSDSGGSVLASFSKQSADLAGTSWTVISFNNGKEAVVSVMAGTDLTANFGQDGQLTGSGGCNNYNAGYVTSGSKNIEIGPVAATRMACAEPAGVMDQESQYFAALSTAATYSIDGNKLELRTADGALAAQFTNAGK